MKAGTVLILVVAMAAAVAAQEPPTHDVNKIKTADFSWMTGRWIGHLQNGTAEQICSTPQFGEMLCLFRVFAGGQPLMYELYTLYDTPKGLELRSLHFSTDLADKTLQQPLFMTLQRYSEKEIVFAGGPGRRWKHRHCFAIRRRP